MAATLSLPPLQRTAPLADQIERFFRSAIQHGRLRAGARLPAIRTMAEQLGVTRNVVQEAYRRLAEAGLVTATVGRGTQVLGSHGENGTGNPFSAGARAARRTLESAPRAPALRPEVELVASFGELLPDQALFPVEEFRASIDRVLRTRGGDVLGYGQPAGNPELRALLAARAAADEPTSSGGKLLITAGAQQGIDLVLRTFTSPGDAVAVAVPTYHQLFGLLAAHGLELVPIASSGDGLDPDAVGQALAQPGVRLLYVMPTFHNPTGRTLDLARRHALMEVVGRTAVPVLEDEFQRELRFAGEALPSLRALDPRGRTVTIRTFSKGLFPGVRTGWVQASGEILSAMVALKRCTDLETSPLLQAALADFLAAGGLERYLAALRTELRVRHAAAQRALQRALPAAMSWSRPEGGFAMWLEGPPALDGDRLAELAAARGVLVTPGRVFDPHGAPSTGVRLSLSRVAAADVERGIEVLGACARDLLAGADPLRQRTLL